MTIRRNAAARHASRRPLPLRRKRAQEKDTALIGARYRCRAVGAPPPPERGRVGVGVALSTRQFAPCGERHPHPTAFATLQRSTSPLQGDVTRGAIGAHLDGNNRGASARLLAGAAAFAPVGPEPRQFARQVLREARRVAERRGGDTVAQTAAQLRQFVAPPCPIDCLRDVIVD